MKAPAEPGQLAKLPDYAEIGAMNTASDAADALESDKAGLFTHVRCNNESVKAEAIEVLRTLRAVRRFSDEPIGELILTDILSTARWTGSAKNVQPWHLVVVRDRNTLRGLAQCGQFAGHLAGAAAAVALVMNGRGNGFDAGRLAQNIMLAAWAHGVGSCIGSIFPEHESRARELLGVPAERSLGIAISLGYPADEAALRVSRSPTNVTMPIGRIALKELVSWDRFGQQEDLQ